MSDPRFARLRSDPRFRRPKKKQQKVVVDERFKSVFTQEKKEKGMRDLTAYVKKPLTIFIKSAKHSVDKYGRGTSGKSDKDDLSRYYRFDDDAEELDAPTKPDLARGEILLESSDEEEEEAQESDDDSVVALGTDSSRPITIPRDDEVEIDLDEDNFEDLEAQAAEYAKAHQDEEGDEGIDASDRTRRLAIVNLDWDHVRAHHLYKICSSLVSLTAPSGKSGEALKKPNLKNRLTTQVNVVRGKVLSVRIYPSTFGKERLAREEREGPPKEIFKKRDDLDPEEINEKNIYEVGGEDEYDEDALRKYQLERLRYYYAVVECDTAEAAGHIYDELEGTELERSANVFDMSFVPDDMSFDDEPRDEASDGGNMTYKAIDFVTDALRHSKVKLTWDDDDPERAQVTRRALTKQEIEDNDFRAYIASSSDESEAEGQTSKSRKKDKNASRDKLRKLLLGGNDDEMPEGWGEDADANDVDMEITFTPGLSNKKNDDEETTLEKYQRKLREKRKKKKTEVKGTGQEETTKEVKVDDEFFAGASDEERVNDDDKLLPNKDKKKKSRRKDRDEEDEPTARTEVTADELALLVSADDPNAAPKHFNLKAVIKAEKGKKRKKKGKQAKDDGDNEIQEDFVIDVKDDRFKALHEDHQFAIDPTNPHFKKTKGMQELLEERQKRQREQRGERLPDSVGRRRPSEPSKEKLLQSLVESVKRKSNDRDQGQGKRRKLL